MPCLYRCRRDRAPHFNAPRRFDGPGETDGARKIDPAGSMDRARRSPLPPA
jgi:hypothetical protein